MWITNHTNQTHRMLAILSIVASSTDSGRTFTKNQGVATNVCPCCKTALATTSDGRLYLSWRQVLPGDFRHIAVAASADWAQTFTIPGMLASQSIPSWNQIIGWLREVEALRKAAA